MKSFLRVLELLVLAYVALFCLTACVQRRLLYFPSHETSAELVRAAQVQEWVVGGEVIGFARRKEQPRRVWLFLHGNGGQAVNRGYALDRFDKADSVYVLEYPGYGARAGKPSRDSFNRAAQEAYRELRREYPGVPVCVLGESLGSGPSCFLASLSDPPSRLVLVVPFDRIVDVAGERFPFLPVRLILLDRWDNVEALSHYHGPVDIYGAGRDTVIPVRHARALAASYPKARYTEIDCEHNDMPIWRAVRLGNE